MNFFFPYEEREGGGGKKGGNCGRKEVKVKEGSKRWKVEKMAVRGKRGQNRRKTADAKTGCCDLN